MNRTLQTVLFWILAFLITVSAAVYQRMTGPTYPKRVELNTANEIVKLKLIRSAEGSDNCPLAFEIADTSISAMVEYRRYPTNDEWVKEALTRDQSNLTGSLPGQPPAGKIEYKVLFYKDGKQMNDPEEYHTIVRYKGVVPGWVLGPHILSMFIAMLLANFAGIIAIARRPNARLYMWLTFAFLTVGGMIMGPLLQLYAFGDLWTGIPFGWDLTDNKTLIAYVAWIVALIMNRKGVNYRWIIVATIVTLIIFSIPHSMFGSEFNYATGSVTQG
ncbi:MAG: hypothetical protein A2W97_17965 [Bacteroidetes bacterium GWE2_40_63]|nr:MAG: hypothetical protein A2W84_07495 [Bacteroidetes bacterium GWC2_40_13]OFX71812.1 MAG: hypothetical protein A2W96_06160 [Bacteroidetes bacterium GWD2_40_43]OFX94609.1 MAG: hypothetical protein A2W97_17965 [Bacteroidetes bacterium GWE2_40_63]OFY22427.1 MAG: hypothetical protein A2W88_07775 [Bacteroidetes bacterium GWF2_40_13]OFZ24376.1 MAG: hypothetical protein A2437_18095 [Bacteroidetes bacterium RIFOXYC2_FULL_40_12]HBX83145.1 hypothetical protein [Marinilabiliales bacterium]